MLNLKLTLQIILFVVLSCCLLRPAFAVLRSGDVVLLSLNCWVCSLIEAETRSNFSHIGVVIKDPTDMQMKILEASSQGVRKSTVPDFLSKRKSGTNVFVYRPLELEMYQENDLALAMNTLFVKKCASKEYDPDFLWENYSLNGEEKYYCSDRALSASDNTRTHRRPDLAFHTPDQGTINDRPTIGSWRS